MEKVLTHGDPRFAATQWFDPEPAPRGLSFARELVRQGFEVEVLTGFPNYPSGRLYPGYRMRWLLRRAVRACENPLMSKVTQR